MDLLIGSLSSDLLFGNNAAVRLFNGLVVSMEADLHDLVTSTMFGMFDALPDRLETALLQSQDGGRHEGSEQNAQDVALQEAGLLDIAVFQRVFELGVHGSRNGLALADVFQNLFQLGSLMQASDQQHSWVLETQDGEVPATLPPAPASEAAPVASEHAPASPASLLGAAPLAETHANVHRDVLATLLGVAGLHLQSGRPIRCRTLLRVASRRWHRAVRRVAFPTILPPRC
jgi:hypothetical protein